MKIFNFYKKEGMTLIELLVVIVVIAILTTIAISQYNKYRTDAVRTQLISDLRNCINEIANSRQTENYNLNLIGEKCSKSSNTQSLSIISTEPIKIKASSQIGDFECEYNETTGRVTCSGI